jgi:hypothetical protein
VLGTIAWSYFLGKVGEAGLDKLKGADELATAMKKFAATETGSTAAPAAVTRAPLKFDPNDLVYGPSANAKLRQLQEAAGGKLLTDLPKPEGLSIVEHSLSTIDSTAAAGRKIHFDLTHMEDLPGVLSGTGPHANAITSIEIRHIQANWSRLEKSVRFYNGGTEVPAPWTK